MAKYLVCLCFVAVAVTAINALPIAQSASTNSGINLMSTNSVVDQNNVQNANALGGFGGYGGFGGFGGFSGYGLGLAAPAAHVAPVAYAPPAVGLPAPYYYDGIYPGHYGGYPHYGLGGAQVNSQSSNTAMNVLSSDSAVVQNGIQNAEAYN